MNRSILARTAILLSVFSATLFSAQSTSAYQFGGGVGGEAAANKAMAGAREQTPNPAIERRRISRIRAVIAESSPKLAEIDKSPATQEILKKLDTVVAMNFPEETPLDDVLKYIKTSTATDKNDGLRIYVDHKGLADADVTIQSPVKMDLEGIPLKISLRLLLKQLDLAYCVKEGLVIISSPEGIIDELREFESAHVPPEQRTIALSEMNNNGMMGGMGGGGMGGGFR